MKSFSFLTLSMAALMIFSIMQTGCSDDTGDGDITLFEGTFVGFYRALIYDTEDDTMTVTVDAATNKVTFTSAILGTSFTADYNPNTERATINALTIDTLKFVQGMAVNYAYNTTVGSGYCEMRNGDTELFVRLNNCSIEDHTIDLLQDVKPLAIPVVNTPSNMKPL